MNDKPKPQRGVRRGDQLEQYNVYMAGANYQPDAVSSSLAGYFYFPAIWIGTEPELKADDYRPGEFNQIVAKKKLRCGIEAFATQNGLFFFDFFDSDFGRQIFFPGYSHADGADYTIPPIENERAAEQSAKSFMERVKMFNVHQLLVHNAARQSGDIHIQPGFSIEPGDVTEGVHANQLLSRIRNPYRPIGLADIIMNEFDEVRQEGVSITGDSDNLRRRVLSMRALEQSFDVLDTIISDKSQKCLDIVAECCSAGLDQRSERFGASHTGFWTSVEQMLEVMWQQLLDEEQVERHRLDKLTDNRSYTSSVKIEILRLMRRLSPELYLRIEHSRRVRNKWIHEMRVPDREEVDSCKGVSENMLSMIYGLQIKFNDNGYSLWGSSNYWISHDPRAMKKFLGKEQA